jgi:DNA primase
LSIPKETIEYIRERVRIEDIAMKYIPSLKKKGRNYIGLCPFHKEKTPSFSVSPDKQIFHCFGCNTGGNVFTFISKIENIDFIESVRKAADIAGIQLRDDSSDKNESSIEKIRRINRYAMNFYNSYLKADAGKAGRDYLQGRGLDSTAIDAFMLGFAPDSWDRLTYALKKNGADIELAEKIGLIGKARTSGNYIDKFRNRVIFPIFDRNSNVIAFGGRAISDKEQPKYLNSPESEVFQKRSVLYGLNYSHNEIRELDRAIIVEGYLDVIGCHINGIKNVVAPLGTALTENHIKILSQHCNEVVMLFDSDSAGINAALKSIETSEHFNVNIKIAVLPQDDPFDYIMKKGVMEMMIIIDKAVNPFDFQIILVIGRNSGKDRMKLLRELFDIVRKINMASERSIYLKKISEILKIDEEALRIDFNNYSEKNSLGNNRKNIKSETIPYEVRIYRELIELIMHYPELAGDFLIDFAHNEINDPVSANIYKVIAELYNNENILNPDKIFDFFQKGLEMDFLSRIIQKETVIEDPKAAYTEIYVNLKLHTIENKISDYAEKIKQSGGDRLEYLAEIEILRREKEKLSNYIYTRGSLSTR